MDAKKILHLTVIVLVINMKTSFVVSGQNSCEKVLYEELTPSEFELRIKKAPIAYLPLGTLEWHSSHLPLGTDGIISREFFKLLAHEIGGIVLPMMMKKKLAKHIMLKISSMCGSLSINR